jgi:hypothetical protein
MLTAPGEMDPSYFFGRAASQADYGKKGKWTFPAMPAMDPHLFGSHHAVLGQANNYLSYLIHRPDNHGWWNFGHPNHYEEFVIVGKNMGDDVGNMLLRMLGSRERYSGRPIAPLAPADPVSSPTL